MADQKISQLAPLAQGDIDTATDQLAIADISAAETKKVTPVALVGAALNGLAAGSVDGSVIADDSITSLQLAPDSVGAVELADDAVDTAAIQDQAVTGAKIADDTITADQIAPGGVGSAEIADGVVGNSHLAADAVTSDKIAFGTITGDDIALNTITGANIADDSVDTAELADLSVTTPKIADAAVTSAKIGAGEVQTANLQDLGVTTQKIADGAVVDGKISGPVSLAKLADGGANEFVAATGTGAPVYRGLVSDDLPIATTVSLGGVSVNDQGGIDITPAGEISLTTTVTGDTASVVTYGDDGRITDGRLLEPGDLPLATTTTVGVVSIGDGLAVDDLGHLSTDLQPDDIPDLDTSKITTGELDIERIGNRSITQEKLKDYAISFIQEATPGPVPHIGALWLQESTGQLKMWNGNSWFPVGFGRLSVENLRYCGIFDASTGLITGITQFGAQGGYAIGDPLPQATDPQAGSYFVAETAGNGTAVTPGTTYDAGDWILCNGAAGGWVRIDTLSGGAGGGGATRLNELLDVTINNAVEGDILVYSSTGQWVNEFALDGGSY